MISALGLFKIIRVVSILFKLIIVPLLAILGSYELSASISYCLILANLTSSIYPPYHTHLYRSLYGKHSFGIKNKALQEQQFLEYVSLIILSIPVFSLVISAISILVIGDRINVSLPALAIFFAMEKLFDESNRVLLASKRFSEWTLVVLVRIIPLIIFVVINKSTLAYSEPSLIIYFMSALSAIAIASASYIRITGRTYIYLLCDIVQSRSSTNLSALIPSRIIQRYKTLVRRYLRIWLVQLSYLMPAYSYKFLPLVTSDPKQTTILFSAITALMIIDFIFDVEIFSAMKREIIAGMALKKILFESNALRLVCMFCIVLSLMVLFKMIFIFYLPKPINDIIMSLDPIVLVIISLTIIADNLSKLVEESLFWRDMLSSVITRQIIVTVGCIAGFALLHSIVAIALSIMFWSFIHLCWSYSYLRVCENHA